ncbi:MAG: CHAT domain-containing protein [Betaproteobacteria bacterium]
MYRTSLLILLAVLSALAQAQQSLTSLEIAGRFAELEKAAEAKVASTTEPSISALAPLCVAYSKLKRYAKLFPCLDAIDRHIAGGNVEIETDRSFVTNSDATALSATLRAQAHLEMGDYLHAVSYAQTALKQIQDRQPSGLWPPTKYRLLNLGVIPVAQAMAGNREEALKELKEIEKFSYPYVGNAAWRPMKAYAMARVYMALDDYAAALPFVASDDWYSWINDPTWGLKSDDAADIHLQLPKLVMRGTCQLETGNLTAAQHTLELALRHPRIAEFGELYWIALYQAGRVAELLKNTEQAIEHYRQAVEVIEMQRASINTEASKIGFVGDKQAVYGRLVSALLANKDHPSALEFAERSKARALVDMLAAKQDFAISSGDPVKVAQLLSTAKEAEAGLVAQGFSQEKLSTRSVAVAAKEGLAAESPELASLVSVSTLGSGEIQALMPVGETLIEYYDAGGELIAFVLTQTEIDAVRLDGKGLTQDILQFREALEEVDSKRYLALSQRLHERLVAPLTSRFHNHRLLVVAHGPLHYLPFNALNDGQSFLIDRFNLRTMPSASILKYLSPFPGGKTGEILAFGNPDLGNPRFDLENSETEAIAITKNRPKSRVLLRKNANESALRQYGEGFRYIHFATHGQFNPEAPLKSALLLSRNAESDGLLTADKIFSLKLDTDLVTLSACETGLGKVAKGDDVVGLVRAFLYAGSRSIVSSLWKVDDKATSTLMTSFYSRLGSMNKREALRQAQLVTKQQYPHPFYWAAFQIAGNAE